MTTDFSLRSLEGLLETFIDRWVQLKQKRMGVIGGINRLDDIARTDDESRLTDQVGNWFAENNRLLTEDVLRPADIKKIGELLGEIGRHFSPGDTTPAVRKVTTEINRWQERSNHTVGKVVLKRGAETAAPESDIDSISLYNKNLEHISALFADMSGGKKHILSVLDDSLKSAVVQKNKQALLLSAYLIYYLKQNGYIVEPFVKRLKMAEQLQKEGMNDAKSR